MRYLGQSDVTQMMGIGYLGEVRQGPNGSPLIFYNLNDHDVARMARGASIVADLFLAAGVDRVFTFLHGAEEIYTHDGAKSLATKKLRAGDIEVTAYHPLGTCRMGNDPATSVVDRYHRSHDVPNLFICDGSSLVTSGRGQPTMTIQALAFRAGEHIARLAKRGEI